MANPYDLIIIGGGPAGLTAAIYGAQAKLNVLLLETVSDRDEVGSEELEDRPGAHDTLGPGVFRQLQGQAEELGVAVVREDVASLHLHGEMKLVETRSGNWHQGRTLILSRRGLNAEGVKLAETGLLLDPEGYILADPETMTTNLPGVYAAGDARRQRFRQMVTAASDGAIAACSAERYLAEEQRLNQEIMDPDQLVLAVFCKPDCERSQEVLRWAEGCVAQTAGGVLLAHIECQEGSQVARRFSVSDVPSVLLLHRGRVLDRLDGNFADFCHWLTESIDVRALARL